MQSRKFSLTLAKQMRTCPPPAVRDDLNQRQEYDKHLSICPYCSAPDTAEREAWRILGDHLKDLSAARRRPVEEVTSGQLRFISHDLAGWRNGLFYNPPLVLVLENVHAVSDDVLVSQTYFDLSMAGPGDLILTDRQIPTGDFFVETWNVYSLKAADLRASPGSIDPGVMIAVKRLQENPHAYPDWAMIPRPFTEEDPRIYFRELEVEVGYLFSSRSVSKLMTELEIPVRLAYDSVQDLQEAIRKVIPGSGWKRPCLSREEVLALVELPAERLPLAAHDNEPITSANLVRIRAGEVTAVGSIPMEIHGRDGELVLSGRIGDLPADLENSRFIAFLDSKGKAPVAPIRCEWDETTGDFLVEFDFSEDAAWRLKAAVVFEPPND